MGQGLLDDNQELLVLERLSCNQGISSRHLLQLFQQVSYAKSGSKDNTLIYDLFLLAQLDYVSRAHEIEICPLSVVRPSVCVAIISEPNAQISFKFWLLLPLSHTLGCFLNF